MFLQFSVSFRQNSSFTVVFHSIGRVTPNARPMGRRLWEWFKCAVFPEWGTGPVCASRVCPGSPRCLFLCLFSDEVRNHTISDVPIGIATATAIAVPTRKRGAPRPTRRRWLLRSSAVTVPGAAGSLGAANWGRPLLSRPWGSHSVGSGVVSAVVRVRWWVWMVDVRFVCGIRVSL
jgi:hypothetical protein